MIILITGTPGTGKTTISSLLAQKLGCWLVDINRLVEEKKLYNSVDSEKGYKVVDLDALEGELHEMLKFQEESQYFKEDSKHSDANSCTIIEGHLSHYFPQADLVVVFRTEPSVLENRLKKRDWKEVKIRENLEAEALDVCTWEAYQIHGDKVHEVDTSNKTPDEVVSTVLDIISGKLSLPPGNIDFSAYFE